ncbi:SigB/SigF/SigG family RNA polymerase sigma factor [Romboutsia lituseburensis]|uniref:RNA polymerase, sigma 37 subunit, RpsB/SigB n=1 Tax=Romboutsia lituseburensis DSM 797 TaxID=1121325 RepID=A0A1G9U514_9FIRM|nr:SigB/SigF/SigG family RNA polymerase sigma factor [Romboutsia lituseburensis]CEH36069.1 RNA polymerase sigma-F factor [Romboutsia lituseburensis]SDM55099.1 RNA polymerase, sigma 37 subunit, RpsB/SigB [Romboutsia lituseburensis DSM 797]
MKNVANATNYLDIDTKELFRLYSSDKSNKDIRDILIERHLYLVNLLAKKYINKGVEFDDIYQVASLALIYAIDRYDIEKGYEFSSFATPTIIGEIKKYFRDKVWTLRVPRRIQELSKKISEAKVILEQKNKKHPKVKDIANYIGCTEEDVLEAMEASYGYQPISLDSSNNDDSEDKDITLIDKIGKEESSFGNIEQMDFVNKFIENLNELEVKIFKDRFFLDKTQSAIAKELDISQMTVSRLERKIVEKLRKEYEKNL